MARNNMGPGYPWFEGVKIDLDYTAGRIKQRLAIPFWLDTSDIGSLDAVLEFVENLVVGAATVSLITTPLLSDDDELMMICDKSGALACTTRYVALSAIAGQGPYLVDVTAGVSQKRQPSAYCLLQFDLTSTSAGDKVTALVRGWAVPRGTP